MDQEFFPWWITEENAPNGSSFTAPWHAEMDQAGAETMTSADDEPSVAAVFLIGLIGYALVGVGLWGLFRLLDWLFL
jgi:hypothetical protein